MDVVLRPIIVGQKQALSDMLDGYLDLLSRYAHEQIPKPYKYLDAYFQESNRKPIFITVETKIVGFALVNLMDPEAKGEKQSIAEFYVLPEHHGQGIGIEAACQIFDMFAGNWIIRELQGNPAELFWKKVIDRYTKGNYIEYKQDEEGRKRNVQEFSNLK